MQQILTRAGCFVAIIILGAIMRRVGVFREDAFPVLSKIVMKITLPAAIISSFAGKEIDPSMLSIALIGLGGCLLYIALAYVIYHRGGKEHQVFGMINTTGYNIGSVTMPLVQSFLGPVGVITTSLFDAGNACICLGTSYSIAAIVKEGCGFSFKRTLKNLVRSVPFVCYIIVVVMNLTHIPIPSPILSFAEIAGSANAFLAMLMIGVGLKLQINKAQLSLILKTLTLRYVTAIILALICYFLLPFALEIRQTLVVLLFSPISSPSPAYTAELQGDVGLASAINSISIICSIVMIVSLLLAMV